MLLKLQAQNNAFYCRRQIALHIHILLAIFTEPLITVAITTNRRLNNEPTEKKAGKLSQYTGTTNR